MQVDNIQFFHDLIPESRNVALGNGTLESDVFAGTSQSRGVHSHGNDLQGDQGSGSFGSGAGYHGDDRFEDCDHPVLNGEEKMERVVDQNFLSSVKPLPPPHTPPTPQGYSTEQLEILYRAKERQVQELNQQLLATKQDGDLHIRLLRENIVRTAKKFQNVTHN